MPIGKFFYVVRSGEDGKPAVDFYADKEAAQLACDIETKGGKPVAGPQGIELEFDAAGKLLTPDATAAELREKLAQTPEAKPAGEETPAAPSVSDTFIERSRSQRVVKPVAPSIDLAAKFPSLVGKVVAFSGDMSLNPPRLKKSAQELGARVASFVTEDTDILIAGEGAGIKLERAREHGVLIITEEQWLDLASRIAAKPKPSPGF